MRRRTLAWLALGTAVPGALAVGAWLVFAATVEDRVADAAHRAAESGWQLSWAALQTGGFPPAVRVRAVRPSAVRDLEGQAVTWSAPRLDIVVRPWEMERIVLRLPRLHEVAVTGGGRSLAFDLRMDEGRLVADTGANAIEGRLEGVSLVLPENAGSPGAQAIDFGWRAGDERIDIVLEGEGVDLNGLAPAGLGDRIERASLDLRLLGRIPRSGALAVRADGWRRAGGQAVIEALVLDWPPLKADAAGTLALDAMLRPAGTLRLGLEGYREPLAAVAGPVGAAFLQAALGLLAQPAASNAGRLDVDLTVENGILSAGPLEIWCVPPLLPLTGDKGCEEFRALPQSLPDR